MASRTGEGGVLVGVGAGESELRFTCASATYPRFLLAVCVVLYVLTTLQSTVRVTPYRCRSVDRTVSPGKVSRIRLNRGGLAAVAPRKVRFIRRGENQSGESGL